MQFCSLTSSISRFAFAVSVPLVLTSTASAASYYVDFGNYNAAPASTYAAAAPTAGVWNTVATTGQSNLLTTTGAASAAQINLAADATNGFEVATAFNDDGLLLIDNFFSQIGASWTVSVSGLANGRYDFFYYAPSNYRVDTGAFSVNGSAAPNLAGTVLEGATETSFVQGTDWQVVRNVQVTDGTLSTVWLNGVSDTTYTGLAGLQIVAVPEPATLACLLPLVGMLRRRRH